MPPVETDIWSSCYTSLDKFTAVRLTDLPDEVLQKVIASVMPAQHFTSWRDAQVVLLGTSSALHTKQFWLVWLISSVLPHWRTWCSAQMSGLRKQAFQLTTICRALRRASFAVFFSKPWELDLHIGHPYQLTRLVSMTLTRCLAEALIIEPGRESKV